MSEQPPPHPGDPLSQSWADGDDGYPDGAAAPPAPASVSGQAGPYSAPPPGASPPAEQPGAYAAPPTTGLPYQGSYPTPYPSTPAAYPPLTQPGVIPIRALSVGDMYNGSLRTMRGNPGPTVGLAFIVTAIALLPSTVLGYVVATRVHLDSGLFTSLGQNGNTALTTLIARGVASAVGAALLLLVSSVLTGSVVYVVSEATLGRKATFAQTWHRVRRRIPALIGLPLLLLVAALLFFGLALAPGLVLLAAHQSGLGALALVLAWPVGLVVLVLVGTRLSLAAAPLVLEQIGIFASLRRSWRLTKGAFWRVFGITLLTAIAVGVVGLAVGQVVNGLGGALATPSRLGADRALQVQLLVSSLGSLVVAAFTRPFSVGVTCLLYLDQRIRREGLDIAVLAQLANQQQGR